MPLAPIVKQTAADAVFDQLAEQIVSGELGAGTAIPSERALTETLGVSRAAIREALQRLAQVGLVQINQGESTRVRDVRDATSLDLLPRLLVGSSGGGGGGVDPHVLRSVLELRVTIGEDAARWCATRADDAVRAELARLVDEMAAAGDDLGLLQALALAFWRAVIDGADNIAYRIAFNSLVAAYAPIIDVVGRVMAAEVADLAGHRRLLSAIQKGDGDRAARAARTLLTASAAGWDDLLTDLQEA